MFSLNIIDRMNAQAIAEKAQAALKAGPDVKHLLARCYREIEAAAERGEFELTENPIAGLRQIVTEAESAAVFHKLKELGYVVTLGKKFRISWKHRVRSGGRRGA